MENPEILALGKYLPSDLAVSVSQSNRKIDPEIESKLEAIWEAKKKKADENGQVCYNGLSYRLNSLKKADNKIILDFGIFEYKARTGLIVIPEYFNLSEEFYHKGCFSSATVKTNDDRYIMVELSGKSMNLNDVDFLGGVMETTTEMKTGENIFQSLYFELEEEACISKNEISESYLRMIFLTQHTYVGFYFEVSLNVSSKELLNRFQKENKDIDIKLLKDFSRDDYIKVLKNHKSKNKQFIAGLLNI